MLGLSGFVAFSAGAGSARRHTAAYAQALTDAITRGCFREELEAVARTRRVRHGHGQQQTSHGHHTPHCRRRPCPSKNTAVQGLATLLSRRFAARFRSLVSAPVGVLHGTPLGRTPLDPSRYLHDEQGLQLTRHACHWHPTCDWALIT